jgi:hypothetical protein
MYNTDQYMWQLEHFIYFDKSCDRDPAVSPKLTSVVRNLMRKELDNETRLSKSNAG